MSMKNSQTLISVHRFWIIDWTYIPWVIKTFSYNILYKCNFNTFGYQHLHKIAITKWPFLIHISVLAGKNLFLFILLHMMVTWLLRTKPKTFLYCNIYFFGLQKKKIKSHKSALVYMIFFMMRKCVFFSNIFKRI